MGSITSNAEHLQLHTIASIIIVNCGFLMARTESIPNLPELSIQTNAFEPLYVESAASLVGTDLLR